MSVQLVMMFTEPSSVSLTTAVPFSWNPARPPVPLIETSAAMPMPHRRRPWRPRLRFCADAFGAPVHALLKTGTGDRPPRRGIDVSHFQNELVAQLEPRTQFQKNCSSSSNLGFAPRDGISDDTENLKHSSHPTTDVLQKLRQTAGFHAPQNPP
jgi:hypothetical protein